MSNTNRFATIAQCHRSQDGNQAQARGAVGDGNTAGIPPVPRPLLLALARQAFAGLLLTAAALSTAHAATLDLGPAEIVESGAEPAAAGGADSGLGSSAQALEDSIARSLQFAQISQSGDGNLARIDQPGIGNQASIVQTGNGGSASIMQSGRGNVASITQSGR